MEELSARGEGVEGVMALVGDFEKAHRRFLHQESERGYLGCRASDEDDIIYVST